MESALQTTVCGRNSPSPPTHGKVETLLLEGEGMGVNAIEVFYIDLPRYNLFGEVPISLSDLSLSKITSISVSLLL